MRMSEGMPEGHASGTRDTLRRRARHPALLLAGVYLVLSVLWIAFSDSLVNSLDVTADTRAWLQTVKGGFFVALSSVVLFGVAYRLFIHSIRSEGLQQAVNFDALTGLPNASRFRLVVERALDSARRSGEPVALMLMEVRGLRRISDSLGYGAADTVLLELRERSEPLCRGRADLARIGDNLFAVLVRRGVDVESLALLAESMRIEASRPVPFDGHDLHADVTIGISVFPEDGSTSRELTEAAERALSLAQRQPAFPVSFHSRELATSAREQLGLEEDLRSALRANTLTLVYQPQVDMRTGRVAGIESLVRWFHPDRGPVAPAHFIPLAEECGLIRDITRFVVRQACMDMAELRRAGHEFRVSVNLSGVDLDERLLRMVDEALEVARLPAGYLEVEVTETATMSDMRRAVHVLSALRGRGVTVALDDFGTGYSAMAYLRDLPLDMLKIDRAFVSSVPADDKHTRLCRSIIAMSHEMGFGVTAEGIESKETLAVLREFGCDLAQGFHFARPTPVHELHDVLARLSNRQARA